MLDAIIDRYLQGVSEREFDMPLMTLLVSRHFYDIHKIHGTFEFGKDFIAKRDDDDGLVRQYAIQSKAGNINQSSWREVRSQIDEARFNTIAHPSYGKMLPRRVVLVTTGRLVGGAAADAQQYKDYLDSRNEISFDVWDQDKLRDWLIRDPGCGMAGGMAADMLAVIAAAETGPISHQQVERYTRRWTVIPLHRVAIEAAVIADKLRACKRADLAAVTALCALRAAHSQPTVPGSSLFSEMARQLHASYATGLLHQYQDAVTDPGSLIDLLGSASHPHFTYSVFCHRLAETWSLLALADHVEDQVSEDARMAVKEIVSKQMGVGQPLSDRWAISLICIVLSTFRDYPSEVASLLESVIVWITDAYDNRLGLGSVDCSELEEIEYILGPSLSHIDIRRRRTSYLATAVLDLCLFLGLRDLYQAAVHDFSIVDLVPIIVLADERVAKWGAGEFGILSMPLLKYDETWDQDIRVPPYGDIARSEGLSSWDELALASLPRNRHPFQAFSELCSSEKS
jgi:hypothetical protein